MGRSLEKNENSVQSYQAETVNVKDLSLMERKH